MEQISIACDGRTLVADLRPAAGSDWRALVLHGWTGSRGGSSGVLADRLAQEGVPSLALDLPGHGESEGDMLALTRADFVRAARAAYDELEQRFDAARTLLAGTSFGAYVASVLCEERTPDALALRVPADYPPHGHDDAPLRDFMTRAADVRHGWLDAPRTARDSRALAAVATLTAPLLVLEAGADETIPARTVRNYVEVAGPARTTHVVVEGAPHSMSSAPAKLAEANEHLVSWLRGLG